MINVTKTFLPPQEQYQAILKEAWDAGWMTNRGLLVKRLEEQLKQYLNVPNIIATTNGTLPLQIAIKALGLTGEIITTPFSYVATTSSIVWEGCTPVYVDIHPDYLTIDETKIEAAITTNTTAILATHVFGNPCAVEEIEVIAKKYKLKVIYDAAHCFGVAYKGKSIFKYGDVSTCSFHATKLFHAGEGGALFTNSLELHEKLFSYHNFGHDGPEKFHGLGINAKMSELQAAMGLSVFLHLHTIFKERKRVCDFYDNNLNFDHIKKIQLRETTKWNYSYYPILFESEELLVNTLEKLAKENILPRRYFFPSLEELPYINSGVKCSIAKDISARVICLPLYTSIKNSDLKRIVTVLRG